jgi:hypothetical protein
VPLAWQYAGQAADTYEDYTGVTYEYTAEGVAEDGTHVYAEGQVGNLCFFFLLSRSLRWNGSSMK